MNNLAAPAMTVQQAPPQLRLAAPIVPRRIDLRTGKTAGMGTYCAG
jgi:hypothetical protein